MRLPIRTPSVRPLAHALLLCGALSAPASAAALQEPIPPAADEAYGDALGTVRLATSCDGAAARHLERGLALLHHMTYEGARAEFARATGADAECALGYWGQAMTYIHPLWSDPPSGENFQLGAALVEEARRRGEKTAREESYIEAVAAYYAPGKQTTERPNLTGFEDGWRRAHERNPDDPEAALFFALAHLGTADPSDKSYAHQTRSGEIAEGVLEDIPDHPGAHHYAIHAYDYPPLADRALEIARSYGRIAPAVPHALHMPTHIFTRLGLWEESIDFNRRSAAAALEHPAGDRVSLHYLHALDYLAYAHLQRGEDGDAQEVLSRLDALEGPFQIEIATPYTFAAVPARLALERQRWSEAARLDVEPDVYPWERFPAMEAITWYARGLGAARAGDAGLAREAVDRLAVLHARAAETSAYWAQQVEIQRLAVDAWRALAEGEPERALATMREAADQEASTEKHPVTPGEVLPAGELLGDMLLELERFDEARDTYETTLERSPRRLNALYGAGRAAELAGDLDAAGEHYRKLVELVPGTKHGGERVSHARAFLGAHGAR